MSARRSARVALAGAALALLVLPFTATAASAHDALRGAAPCDGETVASVDELVLTFSGDVLGADGANLVEVVGPDGRYYETACPTLEGTDVRTPVALGPAGAYAVTWRIVSSDGHPVSGQYAFEYAPDGTASPAPGADAPGCRPAGAAPAADSGLWLGIGIGALAVVAVAGGAWLLIRRPGSGGPTGE